MKKGIIIGAFPKQSLEENFKLAKKIGFDGVELSVEGEGNITMNSTKEEMEKIRKLADDNLVELYSVASNLQWQNLLTSKNEETREKAKAVVKKQIDVASWLGCDTVLVIPGAVGVDFIPNCEIVDYEVACSRALEEIKELSVYAEEKKVSIGLENVGNKMLLSPLEFRDFIDEVGSQYVGAYFDVGNVMRNGYPDQWIRVLGKRIKKIHFKDFNRALGSFVDLMEGNVDFPAVMEALKSIGYDNWITSEVGPVYANYPDMLLYRTSHAMDKIMENYR